MPVWRGADDNKRHTIQIRQSRSFMRSKFGGSKALAAAIVSIAVVALQSSALPVYAQGADADRRGIQTAKNAASNFALEVYRLGPRDKVLIRVFEWRPASDEIFGWEALNSEYRLDAAGQLEFPLVGHIRADGMTTAELGAHISAEIKKHMGTTAAPDTTVEVVTFRPFFVTGDVTTPGEYAYRPGLTVLQSVSVAGGLRRSAGADGLAALRDMIRYEGELSTLNVDRQMRLIRRARLAAEVAERDEIKLPTSVSRGEKDPTVAATIGNERYIFETRRQSFGDQIHALSQLRGHLETELASLESQIATQDGRVRLFEKELATVEKLEAKGLVTSQRLLGVRQTLASLKVGRLSLEARLSRVRQDLTRNELTRLELENKRAESITKELQLTTSELGRIDRRMVTNQRLLGHAKDIAGADAIGSESRPKPRYTIVKRIGDGFIEVAANEDTYVAPGDTLKVMLETSKEDVKATPRGFFGSSYRSRPNQLVPPANLIAPADQVPSLEPTNFTPSETAPIVQAMLPADDSLELPTNKGGGPRKR